LKKLPSEVNMRVEEKDVATPRAATTAKARGASPRPAAPTGKRYTAYVLHEGEAQQPA
jgi:hypothetical protein